MGKIKLRTIVGKTCGTCIYCDPFAIQKAENGPRGYCMGLPPQIMNIMQRDEQGVLHDNWMVMAPEVKMERPACSLWEEKPYLNLPDMKIPKGKKKT